MACCEHCRYKEMYERECKAVDSARDERHRARKDHSKMVGYAYAWKNKYLKLLGEWNDLVPKYNTLKVEKNELKEDNKEIQEHLDDNWEYIERLHEEIAELKKIKLKGE